MQTKNILMVIWMVVVLDGGGDGSGGRFHNFLFVFLDIFCIKNLGRKCPSFVMFFPGS